MLAVAFAWFARLRREIKRGVGCVVSAAAVSHVGGTALSGTCSMDVLLFSLVG